MNKFIKVGETDVICIDKIIHIELDSPYITFKTNELKEIKVKCYNSKVAEVRFSKLMNLIGAIDFDNNRKEKQDSFNSFWNMYEQKGNKSASEFAFMNLSKLEITELIKSTPKYINKTPDLKYRMDCQRYLKEKKWKDFLETKPKIEF